MRVSIGESVPLRAALWMVETRDKAASTPAGRASIEPRHVGAVDLDAVMERCAAGEGVAFDELYRGGVHRVRGFLIRLSGDAALADDLTQETFVRIHRARGTFARGSAALPWMFAIARNAFLDHARRESVRKRSAPRASPPPEASLDGRGDELLAAREMLAVVRDTLELLPMLQREAFVLIRFEGLSVADAAQILGATEAAVKVRAFRAYEALRAALERATGDGPGTGS